MFDTIVVGGGPAGSVTALVLARAGERVLLLEAKSCLSFKVGESLPPAIKPLLRDLGLWDSFVADGHLACYGNQSAWSSSTLRSTEFIKDPHGHGWHLDRPRFDATLRNAARHAGVCVHEESKVVEVRRARKTFEVELGAHGNVRGRWLADCTGRLSLVARQQGVRRVKHDSLVAFVTLFATRTTESEFDSDSATLVESAPEGWWYTALLPSRKRVVVYHTDAGTSSSSLARTICGYRSLLHRTKHIRAKISRHGYVFPGRPKAAAANSARLEKFHGDDWIAAGDSALSFDPLSSQGILTAIYAGLKAGQTLIARKAGDEGALGRYGERMESIYAAYLAQRHSFYGYEQRWSGKDFWKRRHDGTLPK
ncbi:MAG TPA: tryptophan 7-halogenase [Chthoniobacterales bacterium]|nr:tryptophan 7-halogenase [Chthoniobacterales bacterium]